MASFPSSNNLNSSINTPSCQIDGNWTTMVPGISLNSQLCAPGFYCPNSTLTDIRTAVQVCIPSAECQSKRLMGQVCRPQGIYEPSPCPRGSFCSDSTQKATCQAGFYCPLGTSIVYSANKPKPCGYFTLCPAGSAYSTFYGGFMIVCYLDILLLVLYFYIKRTAVRNSKLSHIPSIGLLEFSKVTAKAENGNVFKGSVDAATHERSLISAYKRSMNGSSISICLKFNNMSLTLPSGITILNSVTGEIQAGRFTAILGPSGSGSTY